MLRAPIAAGPLLEALRRDVRRVGTGHTVATTLVLDQVIAIGGSEILAGTYPLVPLIAIGLMLTAAGVYAVLAFAVTRRSKELALRIAIGATARDILRVVTAHSIWLVGAGTTIGIAVTFALSRVVRAVGGAGSFLDTPTWPAFLVPALIIAVVSALATWIPSRRALRLDPAALLRVD
jgi:ABC-type antimicrobial peptide transport system permease subunit